jgi:hypothetical protein
VHYGINEAKPQPQGIFPQIPNYGAHGVCIFGIVSFPSSSREAGGGTSGA